MRRSWSAQSIVEFAFVLPIFLLMTLGVIEGGRLIFTYHEITNAAREGARFAVAHGSGSDSPVLTPGPVETYVKGMLTGIDTSAVMVDADWPGDPAAGDACDPANNPGCPVRVTVTYEFVPIVSMVFGTGSISLSASSQMRIHY